MHAGQITESFQIAKRVLEKHPQAAEGYVLLGRLEIPPRNSRSRSTRCGTSMTMGNVPTLP
jgi:hypothetical protein